MRSEDKRGSHWAWHKQTERLWRWAVKSPGGTHPSLSPWWHPISLSHLDLETCMPWAVWPRTLQEKSALTNSTSPHESFCSFHSTTREASYFCDFELLWKNFHSREDRRFGWCTGSGKGGRHVCLSQHHTSGERICLGHQHQWHNDWMKASSHIFFHFWRERTCKGKVNFNSTPKF